jgi:hypothetical protein
MKVYRIDRLYISRYNGIFSILLTFSFNITYCKYLFFKDIFQKKKKMRHAFKFLQE